MTTLRLRRAKILKRQPRVEERGARRQASEPCPPPAPMPAPSPSPSLRKHHSYPQFSSRANPPQQHASLLIRAVSLMGQQGSSNTPASLDRARNESPFPFCAPALPSFRASHTPAVRSGPPLSCNFCWNTVDKCGRILRRKTQYHCPECRTNLCIVPCFHEYHEAETEVR